MPIRTCTFGSQLDVANALEAQVNLGTTINIATTELPDAGIGQTKVAMIVHEILQVRRADFLCALDDEL